MKKTYLNPELIVVKIQTMQMLAVSEILQAQGNYGDGSGLTLGARKVDFDDSDWEDE